MSQLPDLRPDDWWLLVLCGVLLMLAGYVIGWFRGSACEDAWYRKRLDAQRSALEQAHADLAEFEGGRRARDESPDVRRN